MKALAELTHQLRRRITIHAVGSPEVEAAIAAGFDWIIHGYLMTDEVIGRLAESRIPLIPTLTLMANSADFGHLVGARARDSRRRMLDAAAVTLHKAHRAGVTLLAGTDSGFALTPYGEWHARELELLMKYAGLSALEAIQAATKNAARILGLDGQIGELAPGKLADLIVVDGNPLDDIRVLQDKRRILTVVKDGREVHFDDQNESRRWPLERSQFIAADDLTYDLVYKRDNSVSQVALPWEPEEAHAVSAQIRSAELGSREPD